MFHNKKTKPQTTFYDRKIRELNDRCWTALIGLREKSIKVYILNQTVQMYKEGTPDYEKEVKDLADAKYSLLCEVGEYDCRTAEFKKLLADTPREQRCDTINWDYRFLPSHEVIRNELYNYLTHD